MRCATVTPVTRTCLRWTYSREVWRCGLARSRAIAFAASIAISIAPIASVRADDAPADAPAEVAPPPYWSAGEVRPFVALDAEAGAHVRAIASAGYGRPHWLWAGAEAAAFATLDFTALYAGIRADLL